MGLFVVFVDVLGPTWLVVLLPELHSLREPKEEREGGYSTKSIVGYQSNNKNQIS